MRLGDEGGLVSPWGWWKGWAPVSPLQSCHFQGHPTCCSPTHCLLLESQNESLSSTVETHSFHQDPTAGPKQRKTKAERKHITSNMGPSVDPTIHKANSGSCYQFSMGKRTRQRESLQGSQARRRLISHLSVLSFSTVQKSISDEFLWKLLKQCYFIKDLCKYHQICFPGVN